MRYIFYEKEFCFTTAAITVENIVSVITEIVTGAVTWIGSFIDVIEANPLLLFFAVFTLVGTGVGLIRRLIRL